MTVQSRVVESRAGSVLALYLFGYVAITLIWPFPDHIERFLFPLLPSAGFLAWRGLVWRGDGRVAAVLVPALATLLAAPAIVGTLTRMTSPVSVPALDSFRTTRYWLDATRGGDPVATIAALDAHQRAARGLRDAVPSDACVYTYDLSLVLVLGRRPSFLPPPAARMARGPRWGCDWFLLVANPVQGNPPLYPLSHLRAHAQAVTVTRLRDDDPESPIVAVLMRVRDTQQQ